jgi:uncharacterized protein YndB with AHSA1/START domain
VREIHDTAEAIVDADASVVFDLITTLKRLPEWNAAVEQVIELPDSLTPGATWTVEMHPSKLLRWKSVSTLLELDTDALCFSYRTVNADGNPSYTLWKWDVTPNAATVKVSVRWDVYLETLDRRLVAGPIRKRQLRAEVATSLKAIAQVLA